MKKILIIEDDFYISKLYNRTFTLSGFQVDTAMSGKEALEKGKTNSYDVMLLDVMLGDTTGLEVLQTFRDPAHPAKSTPVFLSTNRGEDEIIKRGFELGMEGYFFKSQYVPQDIVTEINAFFSRQEQGTTAPDAVQPSSPAPIASSAPASVASVPMPPPPSSPVPVPPVVSPVPPPVSPSAPTPTSVSPAASSTS